MKSSASRWSRSKSTPSKADEARLAEARRKVLLVDGHSMIFHWPELRALHGRRTASARDKLAQILSRYSDASGTHVVVVFDGRGAKASEEAATDSLQIFYSKTGQTADAVIERLAAKYASEFDLTVATEDHLERQTVESFGGAWISIDAFRAQIDDAEKDLQIRLERMRARRSS